MPLGHLKITPSPLKRPATWKYLRWIPLSVMAVPGLLYPEETPLSRSNHQGAAILNDFRDGYPAVLREPLRPGPAWFRGDLHMQSAHSDGQCPSQTGTMVPCPVFFTVDASARRGLDFIAITDHNAQSQYEATCTIPRCDIRPDPPCVMDERRPASLVSRSGYWPRRQALAPRKSDLCQLDSCPMRIGRLGDRNADRD